MAKIQTLRRKAYPLRSKSSPLRVARRKQLLGWRCPPWFIFWQFTQRWREFQEPKGKEIG